MVTAESAEFWARIVDDELVGFTLLLWSELDSEGTTTKQQANICANHQLNIVATNGRDNKQEGQPILDSSTGAAHFATSEWSTTLTAEMFVAYWAV